MFRLIKPKGNIFVPPMALDVYGSGTIHPGGVVEMRTSANRVSPGTANTTQTMIFGIGLDYAQGASDVQIRTIPFVPGQLWEADTTNAMTTAMLMIRHALTNDLTINNTTTDVVSSKGVFLAYSIPSSLSVGLFRVVGEFIRVPGVVGQNQSTFI